MDFAYRLAQLACKILSPSAISMESLRCEERRAIARKSQQSVFPVLSKIAAQSPVAPGRPKGSGRQQRSRRGSRVKNDDLVVSRFLQNLYQPITNATLLGVYQSISYWIMRENPTKRRNEYTTWHLYAIPKAYVHNLVDKIMVSSIASQADQELYHSFIGWDVMGLSGAQDED